MLLDDLYWRCLMLFGPLEVNVFDIQAHVIRTLMTSRTLRRRLHHGDVDGKKQEHLEASSGLDGLDEPLLGNYEHDDSHCEVRHHQSLKLSSIQVVHFSYLVLCDQYLALLQGNTNEDLWDDERRKEHLHWTLLFSQLIAQWAQWFGMLFFFLWNCSVVICFMLFRCCQCQLGSFIWLDGFVGMSGLLSIKIFINWWIFHPFSFLLLVVKVRYINMVTNSLVAQFHLLKFAWSLFFVPKLLKTLHSVLFCLLLLTFNLLV